MHISQEYLPQHFCREYVQIKGNALQLGMFMATVLGIKPLMDDWIPTHTFEAFKKMCKRYGLSVREDVIFVNRQKEKIPSRILGGHHLTTTSAFAHAVATKKKGQVHVFIARDKKNLKKGMWYPVIVKDRVIFQPRFDSLRYGYALGYPDCCIRFFRKYNDWEKHSHLYEAFVRTKNQASFLCSPFLKDTPFSYIYHMPCSYDCKQTKRLAGEVRQEIKKREPKYVAVTDQFLQVPFLVFYEKQYCYFKGSLQGNEIAYEKVYFLSDDTLKEKYEEAFSCADTLRLEGRRITLFRKGRQCDRIEVEQGSFAPQHPFIVAFPA